MEPSYAEPSLQIDECSVEGGFVWCHYLQQDVQFSQYCSSQLQMKTSMIDLISKLHLQLDHEAFLRNIGLPMDR